MKRMYLFCALMVSAALVSGIVRGAECSWSFKRFRVIEIGQNCSLPSMEENELFIVKAGQEARSKMLVNNRQAEYLGYFLNNGYQFNVFRRLHNQSVNQTDF